MQVFKAPENISAARFSIFTAGSIEMGKAIDWQAEFARRFEGCEVNIFNPRRDDWDSSWKQEKSDPQFSEQVRWELNAMEWADLIVMYLAPGTYSPISLLEFGLYASRHKNKMIVCCPEGFWRKGNIDVTADYYDVPVVETFMELVAKAKEIYGKSLKISENELTSVDE